MTTRATAAPWAALALTMLAGADLALAQDGEAPVQPEPADRATGTAAEDPIMVGPVTVTAPGGA